MKTIGLLTMHRVKNYGSFLQTFATYLFLSEKGYKCDIINYDYPNEYHNKIYLINHSANKKNKNNIFRRVVRKFCNLFISQDSSTFELKMNNFYLNRVHMTPLFKSEELDGISNCYDVYLTGSDQVWNPCYVGKDPTFLLAWVNSSKKRISYASSFAIKEMPEEYIKMYQTHLSKFSHISVREKNESLANILGISPKLVLDPTLLLSKEEWANHFDCKTRLIKEPYILCYLLGYSFSPFPYAYELIRYIKHKLALKAVIINGDSYNLFLNNHVFNNCGVEEFVNLFYNCNYVVTSSFHGTAFAINFNKPFYTIVKDEKFNDNRQISIIEQLGIDRKCIVKVGTPMKDVQAPVFDYSTINEKLDIIKKESKEYLINSIEH